MLARKLTEDQGNFRSPGRAVTQHVLGRTQVEILPSFPNLCYHRPLSAISPRRFESGDPTPGGARLYWTERRMVLGMPAPLSRSRSAPSAQGAARDFGFLMTESSHSIQEVSEWR